MVNYWTHLPRGFVRVQWVGKTSHKSHPHKSHPHNPPPQSLQAAAAIQLERTGSPVCMLYIFVKLILRALDNLKIVIYLLILDAQQAFYNEKKRFYKYVLNNPGMYFLFSSHFIHYV